MPDVGAFYEPRSTKTRSADMQVQPAGLLLGHGLNNKIHGMLGQPGVI